MGQREAGEARDTSAAAAAGGRAPPTTAAQMVTAMIAANRIGQPTNSGTAMRCAGRDEAADRRAGGIIRWAKKPAIRKKVVMRKVCSTWKAPPSVRLRLAVHDDPQRNAGRGGEERHRGVEDDARHQGEAAHGVEGVQAFAAGVGHGSDFPWGPDGVSGCRVSMHQQV